MSRSLYMYLFFFALLLVLFMFFNQKRIFNDQQQRIDRLERKYQEVTATNDSLAEQNLYLNYFTLVGNDNAMSYFERLGHEAVDIENYVRESIYEFNEQKGNNPMVPYDGINGVMKINKLKFLNHRWIVADFTDGTYWGEMVLEYFIEEDQKITFNTLGSVLYAN